jgi:hypothetical protein
MWKGFRRDETTATLMDVAAGSMIWTGWCEEAFEVSTRLLQVPPLEWQGYTLLTPNLLLIEASAVLFLVMTIFLGANKDTQCGMFLWFHRNLRIWPARRTAGYERQFARVAVMEYLFVDWLFYIINIAIFDPRILGPAHPATAVILALDLAWAVYLLWKLAQLRAPGAAFRYAIPTVGAAWILVETGAYMRLYTEIWVHPEDYPGSMLAMSVVFVAMLGVFVATSRRASAAQAA